jgi:hypothetical protein
MGWLSCDLARLRHPELLGMVEFEKDYSAKSWAQAARGIKVGESPSNLEQINRPVFV